LLWNFFGTRILGISEQALLTNDLVTLKNVDNSNTISASSNFGAITNISGMYFQKFTPKKFFGKFKKNSQDDYPEGIVGMAYSKLSGSGSPTLFDAFVKVLKKFENFFLIQNFRVVWMIYSL
jgi:hypothetical protein